MILQFIDRDGWLEELNRVLDRKSAALVLLYGRKRVGKMRLVQEFLRGKHGLNFYVS